MRTAREFFQNPKDLPLHEFLSPGSPLCAGCGFEPERSDEIARLAVDTGMWPLKEAVAGKVRHTYIPNRFRPVTEYLEPQRRFRHLFLPQRRDDELARIQQNVDAYWQSVRATELAGEPTATVVQKAPHA